MVYHSIVLNVKENTNTAVIDIYQSSGNSHQLLIKLIKENEECFDVSNYNAQIEFIDYHSNSKVISSSVDIINGPRGYLSYVVGDRLVKNSGRYTAVLKLINKDTLSQVICSFVISVSKDPTFSGCDCCTSVEVTISKEFYNELVSHLDNEQIHVTPTDRIILNFLAENLDNLATKEDVENLLNWKEL